MDKHVLAEAIWKQFRNQRDDGLSHVGDYIDGDNVSIDGWFNLIEIAAGVISEMEEKNEKL